MQGPDFDVNSRRQLVTGRRLQSPRRHWSRSNPAFACKLSVAAFAGASAILASLMGAVPAAAADSCSDQGAPANTDIEACTRMISSGNFSEKSLAVVYHGRGKAYHAKGEHDRAIADYDEAIRLDPNNAVFYKNR